MKVLLSWLKDYVDIDVTPKELEEKLFSAGLEVEEVAYLGENIEKIYAGHLHRKIRRDASLYLPYRLRRAGP